METSTHERSATVLIATEGEWVGRALESVLSTQGYAIRRTQSGREALRLARRTKPDAVIVDQHTAEIGGIELCRLLSEDPMFDASTPLILVAGAPATRVERSAAYAAGAWTFCTQPVDTEILVRELGTFVRAKRAAEASREDSLIDPTTGLLSPAGLERWAEKLAARAVRKHEPLACVVLMATTGASGETSSMNDIATAFIEISRAHMRQSDIVGRTSDGRLAMLAPDTDGAGVLGFVQRLRAAIEAGSKALSRGRGSAEFLAGYYAIDDFSAATVEPAELIRRATRAVDHANRSPSGELAFNFNQLPLN